jgi:DNA-binding transcriptional regulator LsrR (DeoR family)
MVSLGRASGRRTPAAGSGLATSEDEAELMTRVARMFYLEGMTRVEIADRLNASRFKVARILEAALKTGVVTITIRPPGMVDQELSDQLADRYHLQEAHAVRVSGSDLTEIYAGLGKVVATLLSGSVSTADVLGFDSGRTVSHIADHLSALPPCDVVQLSGLAGSLHQNGLEVLRRVTAISGGTAYPLYAPMIAPDAPSAIALREHPGIHATMDHYRDVTVAIVSVGSWNPPISQAYDRLTPRERGDLLEAGVIADTCAFVFGEDGRLIPGLSDRRIGIPLNDLQSVRRVLAVAGGEAKAKAIRGLLLSGLVTGLVTDEVTASALLTRPS